MHLHLSLINSNPLFIINLIKTIPSGYIRLTIPFTRNNFKPIIFSRKIPNNYLKISPNTNIFRKVSYLCETLSNIGKNVLFISESNNINYLPVSKENLFRRNTKMFFKLIKFFNVGAVLVFDLKKKNFLLRHFLTNRCISISFNKKTKTETTSFNINTGDNDYLLKYTLFVLVLKIYKHN